MTNSFWRLPGAPLQSSVIRAVVTCLLVTLGFAPFVASFTMSGADYIRRALAFYALAAFLVIGKVAAHHPLPRFGAANFVTLLRAALTAGIAGLIGESASDVIAILIVVTVVVIVLLDGVDGWLARRSGEVSPFGARFDMETDAALILILSVIVWQHGKAGIWVIACGLMRYGFVVAGWVLPWMTAPLRSTLRGKAVAVAQIVGLALALVPFVQPPLSDAIAAVTLATLVWSFAVDIAWLKRQARATVR